MSDIFGGGQHENAIPIDERSESNFDFENVFDQMKDEPMLQGFHEVAGEADLELTQEQIQIMDQAYYHMSSSSSRSYYMPEYPPMVDNDIFSTQQPKINMGDDAFHYGLLHGVAKDIEATSGAGLAMVNAGSVSAPPISTRDTFVSNPGTSHAPNGSIDLVPFGVTTSVKNGDQNLRVSEKEAMSHHKLIQLRPRQTKHQKQAVPDDKKDEVYFDKRTKNTLAARRCREKKRELDESRVSMLKTLVAENECLRKQVAEYAKDAEITKGLRDEITLLKQVLQKMFPAQN